MKPSLNFVWICLAMMAFAGNSLLNRLALTTGARDAASFTAVRLAAALVMLSLLVWWLPSSISPTLIEIGSNRWLPWLSATALFVYAAGFSWAYLRLTAA